MRYLPCYCTLGLKCDSLAYPPLGAIPARPVANTFQACTFSATCRQFQFGVSALSLFVDALSLFVSAVPARCVAPMSICRYAHFFASLQTRCSIGAAAFRPRSRAHDAGLSPCARKTIREAISRDTSSSQHAGHAVRKNCIAAVHRMRGSTRRVECRREVRSSRARSSRSRKKIGNFCENIGSENIGSRVIVQ